MIKHIVLFKLRDDVQPETLSQILPDFRQRFHQLQGQIDSLRSIEVGINVNPAEKFHLSLTATFDNMEGLEQYATDPRHVAVGKDLRNYMDARSCVDYEL